MYVSLFSKQNAGNRAVANMHMARSKWLHRPRSTRILVSVCVTSRQRAPRSQFSNVHRRIGSSNDVPALRSPSPVLVFIERIRVCHKTGFSQRDARKRQLQIGICQTVGVGLHCWARLIWQLRSGRVCSACQFRCWSVEKWLWISNEVVQSLGLACRLVLASLMSLACLDWDWTMETSFLCSNMHPVNSHHRFPTF